MAGGGCSRLKLKLQKNVGSYLALGTTDKPIRILIGRTFCFMNQANLYVYISIYLISYPILPISQRTP